MHTDLIIPAEKQIETLPYGKRIGIEHMRQILANPLKEVHTWVTGSKGDDYCVMLYSRSRPGLIEAGCRKSVCETVTGEPCKARRYHNHKVCRHMADAMTPKAIEAYNAQ